MKDYLVIFEQADDGAWGVHSPDVEGVFALGATREEAESRIVEALSAHLAYLRETGRKVPEPHTDAARVAAA
jgi:predicted RNase H-like HicB family nuclease